MAVDVKDVEQVAQELQAKFDDFKAKTTNASTRSSRKRENLPEKWKTSTKN